MSHQLTFADSEFSTKRRQTRKEIFLSRMEQILPWQNMTAVIEPFYPKAGNGRRGTVAKLAMRQPFVLFKGLTFQKLCLPGAFRPGDHHNKMLRPGLCVVHASPQYL
ncbi:hypothetical protein WP3W18E02_P12790 (plasmid) [Klebsiella sp. WP3-W18-ESBL-02]|nr:hypothetical protein WP3W18E02_P12790 [Klebsiella sp. WP3-W18-ESBL-02]